MCRLAIRAHVAIEEHLMLKSGSAILVLNATWIVTPPFVWFVESNVSDWWKILRRDMLLFIIFYSWILKRKETIKISINYRLLWVDGCCLWIITKLSTRQKAAAWLKLLCNDVVNINEWWKYSQLWSLLGNPVWSTFVLGNVP